MSVILNHASFPPSLPSRPPQSTYPITCHTARSSPSGTARLSLAPLPITPLSSSAHSPLHHPLPPRPQTLIPSAPESMPASQHTRTTSLVPPRPNDFDHVLNDPLCTPCENREEDGYRADMALSGPPSLNPSPARLQTPSVDVETTSSPSAVAPTDAAHNATEDRSENAETVHPVNDVESTASHISDTAPEASIDRETDAISSSAASSASNTSAMDGEYTNPTLCPDRVPGHSSVPGKDPLPTQSIEAEKPPTSESSRACSAEKSLDGMPTLSEGAADIPTPIVVIPPPPRSPDLVRCQDQVPEEQDWDSGPSDDEKDADYEDSSSEEERIDRSLRSSKRQKINLISEGGALSNQETQPFPGSHALSQNETTPTSDRIPVQGFFRVGCHGTQVTYYFEFSQTALSLPISHQSSSSPPPEMGNKRKRTRLLYTPEEDAYIIELKNDNVPWAEIEERFAERFPYRKATSLQAHYFNKLKP